MRSTRTSRHGFTVIELLIIVAVLAILALVFIPDSIRTRDRRASRLSCANNLKQIGLSFRTWALDNNDKYPMQVAVTNGGTKELIGTGQTFMHFAVMSNELSTPKILLCPQERDSNRIAATTFQPSLPMGVPNQIPFTNNNNISYFVGVDAVDTRPEMFLSGDRNLVIDRRPTRGRLVMLTTNSIPKWNKSPHGDGGYIGLADGSVQGITDRRLRLAVSTNSIRNRFEFP